MAGSFPNGMGHTPEDLKIIRFEGEMLPAWAQLLDLAARLCPVAEGTRAWFSRLTNSAGVDDARIILAEVEALRTALRENKPAILDQLERTRGDGQAARIVAAWDYSLDTMIQEAACKRTCSWKIEEAENSTAGDHGGWRHHVAPCLNGSHVLAQWLN
jgi:hypothetical protein